MKIGPKCSSSPKCPPSLNQWFAASSSGPVGELFGLLLLFAFVSAPSSASAFRLPRLLSFLGAPVLVALEEAGAEVVLLLL